MTKESNTMSRIIFNTRAMILMLCLQGTVRASEASNMPPDIRIIPKPGVVQKSEVFFSLNATTAIYITPSSAGMQRIGQYLADFVVPATGFKLPIESPWFTKTSGIVLNVDASRKELGDEGYTLISTPKCITITAARPAGVFYGVQTLRQLLPLQIESSQKAEGVAWTVPCVAIEDRPRFKWRGYLLDPARNFRTKAELKRYIDLLALTKLNAMQIHLTDDQGWRVEIKKYPKLIETGSRLPDYCGRRGEGWFYSQADIKEIVKYASDRYVTLVPEIEMPGHSGAAVASYPELACGGKPLGGWSAPLCVSQESTFEYATNVLNEVIALFPSPYIHIGADEVPPGPWRNCPKCKAMMDKLAVSALPADVTSVRVQVLGGAGLPFHQDIGRLQGDFVRKIDQHLASKGRKMVGWDEILEGGLKAGSPAVVMAWRGVSAVTGASGQKHDVVVTLHPDYYLDNDISLQRTYEYEPMPADLPASQKNHLLGVQGNMWGETTSSLQKVDARTFPRLCAIAETGWALPENKDFKDFSGRLTDFRKRLEMMGVTCGKN